MGLPWTDEVHQKGTAEPSNGEATLGDGQIDSAGGGGGVGADFGGVVDEVAGDGDSSFGQHHALTVVY